ncbi:putative RNA polymerase II subunit B1 CTD phosphatase rpap2 [Mastacembelus armatus]|uniref:putative RNA polymerase II subunit B1 CTD phosphatase rpap2 n=1 Tax=Mastacembelus armatus TaxID=205130 RepID=UPI000E454540|nr:putative RNA polymerase II subunit B1 CTD phosphatase RPAP2 [Mastacembelus armatus]
MEAEVRRKSQGSSKTSKKGGKRVRALSAEEEARRREEVKEKLREKLELEKRALKVVERLLDDSVTEDFLVDCVRFITPANYKDTVEERSIVKLCGYPLCPSKLGKIPTQQYKISTKTNKVYDISERKCFCSNFCYKASKEFELQIPRTPLWLRKHESPPDIKLLKKGDGGSSGEEVMLSGRCVQEGDIESPLAALSKDPHSSQLDSGHSDSSDTEQEQHFVSSVVSQRQAPRVHWGDLPKRTDDGKKGERVEIKTRNKQGTEGDEDKMVYHPSQGTEREEKTREGDEKEESDACKTELKNDSENPKDLHVINTDQALSEEEDLSVEEATAKLSWCSLSERVTHDTSLPIDLTATQAEHTSPVITPSCKDLNPCTENRHHLDLSPTLSANQNSNSSTLPNQPDLNITQVGMSKRGAAGLRDLLKNHAAAPKPDSIRLNLLECLRRTLKEWSTDETLKFLYGADHSLGSPFADVREEKEEEEEEELDEDDLEDEANMEDSWDPDNGLQKTPVAAAPHYKTLRKETELLELRVREFYKGTWILPEEVEEPKGNKVTVQDQRTKDPVLPLVDSHAQHLIQKRITVEKLTSCLRNIVGPLHLTVSDISTDLNNLVRTFRFNNSNIIHKTPQWTLIAVVLLHLLSEVSPVVEEALKTPASVDYLNTLMDELGLQEQDLFNLVQQFKTQTH